MLNIFIHNYLKNLDIDKAILISKQFDVEFSYEEMKIVLPFVRQNYRALLDEKSKTSTINNLASISNYNVANKCDKLIDKVLIILS